METGKITRQLCAATLGSKSKQRAAQISAAILVGFIALTSAPVRSEKACDAVSKAGLEEALGHILGKGVQVPLAVSDAVADYLTNPDDKKFSAAMNALANGAVGIAVPGAGWAFVGGKLVFAGVDYTIEEAKALQLDAFLCEAGGLIDVSFFQFPGVQRLANGIDCRNFTEKIKTIDDFVKLETQFKIYKTYVLGLGPIKLGGKENVDSYSEILDNEWKIITTTWKIKVGAALIEKLSADLIREAEALKAKQSCTTGGTEGTTTTDGAKEPQMAVGAAQLIWGMELAGKITTDGTVAGNYTNFSFTGKIIEPDSVSGAVACHFNGTGIAENSGGIYAAGFSCETSIQFKGSPVTSKWTAVGRGYVNYDGHILKSLGRGTRVDTGKGGVSYDNLGVELTIHTLITK